MKAVTQGNPPNICNNRWEPLLKSACPICVTAEQTCTCKWYKALSVALTLPRLERSNLYKECSLKQDKGYFKDDICGPD